MISSREIDPSTALEKSEEYIQETEPSEETSESVLETGTQEESSETASETEIQEKPAENASKTEISSTDSSEDTENDEISEESESTGANEIIESDVAWHDSSYQDYAERMVGMTLYKTDAVVQFYNTYIDENRLSGETTIDSLFDGTQEGYSTELILSLNPVQLTESAPVFKGEDGAYYAVTSVYEMNGGSDPRDSQPATSFYNYLAEAFTDVEYIGHGVFRIPAERYDYCFNGHYFTDGPAGNIVEVVFGLRIQSLYGYDAETASVIKPIPIAVTDDGKERTISGVMNLTTGTIEAYLFSDESEKDIRNYDLEAVVNLGESEAQILSVSDNGKKILFNVGDSRAIGAFTIAISSEGEASTGLLTPPVVLTNRPALKAAALKASSTVTVNNITYLELPEGYAPDNLAVGDKFIYQKKNVYVASVQNANDGGNYSAMTGTYNGSNPGTNVHKGAANIPTHDAERFCYYNELGDWSGIRNWFSQNASGYSALNDATKPDTDTAVAGSMRPMTVDNMNARAANNGTSMQDICEALDLLTVPVEHRFPVL